MKIKTTLIFLIFLSANLLAQDEGYMYGKITTVDGRTFQGPIRWGKEEVLWVDLFNAAKPRNENLKFLSREDIHYLEDKRFERNQDWGNRWFSRWVSNDDHYNRNSNYNRNGYYDGDEDFTHQFVCQFGEIKSIKPSWRSRAEVEMRNGTIVEVHGEGYNDVGGEIRILDSEIGEFSIEWSRIEKIDFQKTPSKLKEKFSEALYGTVESSRGKFTGFIAWDNDERLQSDKLDGRTSDGKLSIEFEKIASIEQSWDEAEVILKSGRKLVMCCTNDVNNENRGVIVEDEKLGKVSIPWKQFQKVTFSKPAKMKSYDEFAVQKELTGTVIGENDKSISGRIVYDLDEEYSYEVLQGKDNNIEYFIPFSMISKITPRGWSSADLELKNGTKLYLEEGQDVSDRHQGILVFSGNNDPVYIRWEKVKEIKFN